MRWQKVKGASSETWAMRGLRIRRTVKGFLLYEAQQSLPGVGTKVREKTFGRLADAKKWAKTVLELG
jgi:hypothetical protein